PVTPAIGRHLQTVLKERDSPTDENHFPQCAALVAQMAIPGDGHEQIAAGEEKDGAHLRIIRVRADLQSTRSHGSGWESNPPGTAMQRLNGFEDRGAHQEP